MCGIIHAINFSDNKEPVNEWIINQYQDQYDRGQKGFGAAIIVKDDIVKTFRATTEAKILLDLYMNPSRHIMFHHRSPTSSYNTRNQTHPILVEHGSLAHSYLVVHNGVIHNHAELKKLHEDELGFVYTTKYKNGDYEQFNDSEALAIEIARHIENQTEKIGAFGSVAFSCLQMDKKTGKALNAYFGRNSDYALNLSMTRDRIRISSEGKGNKIATNKLYRFDLNTHELTKKKLAFAEEPKPTYNQIAWQDTKYTMGFNNYGYRAPSTDNIYTDDTPDFIAEDEECATLVQPHYEQALTEIEDMATELCSKGFNNMDREQYLAAIGYELNNMWDAAETYYLRKITSEEKISAKATDNIPHTPKVITQIQQTIPV